MTSPTDDTFARVIEHLGYFGYEVGTPEPDGWSLAQHPARYDFHVRPVVHGIRLHCIVGIGAASGSSRAAWLDYLNTANERARFTQFSLTQGKDGTYAVRMRGFASGDYSRQVFAMMMDFWHEDLDLIRHKPEFPAVEDEPDGEGESAPVTVN